MNEHQRDERGKVNEVGYFGGGGRELQGFQPKDEGDPHLKQSEVNRSCPAFPSGEMKIRNRQDEN